MKKVYDIDINDLKDLLAILTSNINDPMVQVDALCLEEYIQRYERNFSDKQPSLYERLIDDANYVKYYKPFYVYSKQFAAKGRSQSQLSFKTNYSQINLSDEEAVQLADDFFKEQNDFFYLYFLEFKEEAENHLKFIGENVETSGETLMIKSTGEAFVFVPNYSNITKFTILTHELEHVIDFFSNPDFLQGQVISETAALFMELIACDFIANRFSLVDDNFQRRRYLHTIIKSQATILGDKIQLLDLVNRYKGLAPKSLFKALRRNDFYDEDISFFLEATITQDNSYQIPYMIAVELYVLYHSNKKLALKILQDIILEGNADNILNILRGYGIKLNGNMLNYERKLYKK